MEEWRDIKGYEGLYQVSNLGRVKSLKKIIKRSGWFLREEMILKPLKSKNGYLRVCLFKGDNEKTYYIHRLVAEAFIPNPNNLPEINHKNDEDKTDNRAECLEWCDRKYNCNFGTRNKRVAEKNLNGKLSKAILQCNLQGEPIKEWPSISEAHRQLGFHHSNITDCCKGRRKSVGGYIWKFAS